MSGGEESLWSGGLAAFRDATASAEPTPGGGSVAGVSATLGLGLVIMALEISVKRKDAVEPERARELIGEARILMERLSGDADDDILAFRDYMAALKLPKQTEEEKAARREALQAASRRATESPLTAARDMLEGLRLADQAEPLAHSHVVSDVGAGTGLLDGALKAVLFNVDVNLPSLTDGELKQGWAEERASLARQGVELAAAILARISQRLGGG